MNINITNKFIQIIIKYNLAALLSYILKYISIKKINSNILLYAFENNSSIQIIDTLLKYDFDFNIVDTDGNNLIIYWIENNYPERILKKLIKLGINIENKNNNGKTPLMFAVYQNNFSKLKKILKYSPNVDITDHDNSTPLLFAIKKRKLLYIKELINRKCNLNIVNKYGDTALSLIIDDNIYKNLDIIKLLITNGASPYLQDVYDIINIDFIKKHLNLSNKETLRWYKQELYYFSKVSQNLNFILDASKQLPLEELKTVFGNINILSKDKLSLLMVLLKVNPNINIINYLLKNNINIKQKDKENLSCYDYLVYNFNHKLYLQIKKLYKPTSNEIISLLNLSIKYKNWSLTNFILNKESIFFYNIPNNNILITSLKEAPLDVWKNILSKAYKIPLNFKHNNPLINKLITLCKDCSLVNTYLEKILNCIIECIDNNFKELYEKYLSFLYTSNQSIWNNELKKFSFYKVYPLIQKTVDINNYFEVLPDLEHIYQMNPKNKLCRLIWSFNNKEIVYDRNFIISTFDGNTKLITNEYINPSKNHKIIELLFTLYRRVHGGQVIKDIDSGKLKNIHPYDFEKYCANILENCGFETTVTQYSGDQGIDIIAKYNNKKIVIQCKRYNNSVGNRAVQEIFAGKQFLNADFAIVVTTSNYSLSAQKLAKKCNVKLLSITDLPNLINILEL